VWLLQVFLEAMHQKHPILVITDGDHTMAKAIEVVLPNIDHRLCSWHIEQNMGQQLHGKILQDFRKLIYHPMDVEEFEGGMASSSVITN
jgi:transposase-like protein